MTTAPDLHALDRSAARERRSPPGGAPRSDSLARLRRRLRQLACRCGEIRLVVRDGHGVRNEAADLSEALDTLNEDGVLRYGGMRREGEHMEFLYLLA